jgi:hypothetical protein
MTFIWFQLLCTALHLQPRSVGEEQRARAVHVTLTLHKSHTQLPVGTHKKRPWGDSQRARRRDIAQDMELCVAPWACRGASTQAWPWDGLKLSHARMRPGSNPGLPRATSRRFARAPGRGAYWVSGGFPLTNCMRIPSCGARPKL